MFAWLFCSGFSLPTFLSANFSGFSLFPFLRVETYWLFRLILQAGKSVSVKVQYRRYLLLSYQMEDSGNSEKDALIVSVPLLLYQYDYRKQLMGKVISRSLHQLKEMWITFFPSPDFSAERHSGFKEMDLWISITMQIRRALRRVCWTLPCWWPMPPNWKPWWSKDLLFPSTSHLSFLSACRWHCKSWWECSWYSLVCGNSKNHWHTYIYIYIHTYKMVYRLPFYF